MTMRMNKPGEPAMSSAIEEAITDLGNSDKPLLSSNLVELSNLSPQELELLEQMWADIEPKRRLKIMSRLVELAEDNVELNFDDIFKHRLTDQHAEVRSKAIEGLWENEETSLIKPLIDLLNQDGSEKVMASAATALGRFAMLAEFQKLSSNHTSRVCQALLTTIDDKSKPVEVRRRALEAASPLSLPQIKKAIAEAYRSRNSKLKASAIYAMGKSCDYGWLPILLKELGNDDSEIRYEAAGACGELGEEEAAPHLRKLVNDPDIDVQIAAIQALGKIGGREAKDCLKECLNSADEVIQQAAAKALEALEAEEDPLSFEIFEM